MTRQKISSSLSAAPTLVVLAGILCTAVLAQGQSQTSSPADCSISGAAIVELDTQIRSLRRSSFPELTQTDLRMRAFHSQSDYFRTRFSFSRFLRLRRMRYFVEINPDLFKGRPPSGGVCAILAHELVHVDSLSHGNRIRRFGLVRLLSKGYTAKFERGADLEAIHRGFGDGLKSYRTWVYAHIPRDKIPGKLRNYFSPEEIEAIQARARKQPDIFAYWSKHVPMNLEEIQNHGQ